MGAVPSGWTLLTLAAHLCGALTAIGAALLLVMRRDRFPGVRLAMVVALTITAIWAGTGLLWRPGAPLFELTEMARGLAWLIVLSRLFAYDGRHAGPSPVRPVLVALILVSVMELPVALIALERADMPGVAALAANATALLRLLLSVGGLVLVHNLYGGASRSARVALRWPAAALAAMWLFDVNYFAIAYLIGGEPVALSSLRGLTGAVMALPIVFGSSRGSENLRFQPSRAVAFQSLSLLLIGAYLVAMVAFSRWLAATGGDWARVLQLAFVAMASGAALVVLPSRRLRGWLRVTLTKHLFQHRYDYRAEWLRFTRTIGEGAAAETSLHERIIRALAQITECPGGVLLVLDDHGGMVQGARWQWPTAEVPAEALVPRAVHFFEQEQFIVDLDDLRAGRADRGEDVFVPAWLMDEPRAWIMVPLLHFERLVGMVVLARGQGSRQLDWEDIDLLRVAGQQLASYLAEHAGQEALAEAGRFDDFHRRIAFVMHDIKNLASQLSLLARNAEQHADNPEFQADMLVTLRNSADKLNALLARLSRYGAGSAEPLQPVKADGLAAAVVERLRLQHPVVMVESEPCTVAARPEALEQALVHLVQNAIEASPADTPVLVRIDSDVRTAAIEIADSGPGMSPEFIRNRLFKPFVSSKSGGFGIGAYEARELVRAMGGRLDVESREGLGSRFIIRLPLADAADLYKSLSDKRVA